MEDYYPELGGGGERSFIKKKWQRKIQKQSI